MKIERDWFRNYLKKQLPSALVMAGLWLVLQISACLGWRHFLLSPLYFVSGALAGLEGGSVLGGVLGRTLLLLFLQEGIRTLFFSGLPFRRRLRETGRMAVDSVSGVVPYLRDLKDLIPESLRMFLWEGTGFFSAVLLSVFLSGDGSLQNSFINLLLFVKFADEMKNHSGILYSLYRRARRMSGKKEAEHDYFSGFAGAHALGYAAGPLLCLLPGRYWTVWLGSLGLALAAAGLLGVTLKRCRIKR